MVDAILRIVPTFMSLRVATEAIKLVPKKREKPSVKKFVKGFTNITVGTALTRETAKFIGS